MLLTLVEDFTGQYDLDMELLSVPQTGYYLNSGVHAYITIENLVNLLPNVNYTFADYDVAKTYGKYTETRKITDIVIDNNVIYQSIAAANIGNDLDDDTKWMVTNIESLRIKSFYLRSLDAAKQKIRMTRRLVDNQYLYNVADLNRTPSESMLSGDYSGWVFEPKGSDYVSIRINEAAIQAKTATPQNLYVVNQGALIDTLTLNPTADGRLVFEDVNYVISGKGAFYLVIESRNVLTNGSFVDPLNYTGFTACTCSGTGTTPQGSTYTLTNNGNGLSFNVSVYFDGLKYLNNNIIDFGSYLQSAWQLDVLNAFLANPDVRINKNQRNISTQILMDETKLTNVDTAVKRFNNERKGAMEIIGRTVDNELKDDDNDNVFTISIGSI
jgi:hypothetical protein